MEIVIGAVPKVGLPTQQMDVQAGYVEAQVLSTRAPRRRREGSRIGPQDRRDKGADADPASGRVLVLLVPEGYQIPKDLTSGKYRVILRFAPRRK